MKQTLLFLSFFICLQLANAQFQIHTVNVTTNSLVYDSNTNRIYASIPSANGSNGNSLGVINPDSYQLENTIFIGSEPTVLAISDNGQYIYSGFSGSGTIRRFNVASQTAEIQFPLGNDPSNGAFFADDLEVVPGQPLSIAVSRMNAGFSPRHEGVAIYDNGIMRATTTADHTGSNKIEFKDNTSLFGYNNETTEFGLRRLSINAGGVSEVSVDKNLLNNFGIDFIYQNNFVYATDGKVVNVTSAPYVAGQFTEVKGPAVFDVVLNKVCYASYTFNGVISFKIFNPNTFLLEENLSIPQASGNVKSIVKCGDGCYAFNTSDNKVVIVKNPTLSVDKFKQENKMVIHPNPTSDRIYIQSDQAIQSIHVYDVQGRKVNNINLIDNSINLENVLDGIYLLKIMNSNGNVSHRKVIKK